MSRRLAALVIAPVCVLGLALVAAPAGAAASDRSPGLTRGDRAGVALAAHMPQRPSPSGAVRAQATAGPQVLPLVGPPPTQIVGPANVYGEYYGDFVTSPTRRLLVRNLSTGSVSALSYLDTQCPDEPRVSPNGKQIAFLDWGRDCNSMSTLLVLDLPSGTMTTIASPPAFAWLEFPNWSPDGSKILYTFMQDDSNGNFLSSQMYTISPAGGASTAITGGGVNGEDGVYSPDGTKIAYAAAVNTPANYLAIMNADGTGVLNLPATGVSDYSPFNPAWSPDGSKISYSYAKRNTAAHVVLNHGVAVVNADGSGNHVLAITSAINWNGWISSWSADGSEIYLDSNQRSTTSGYVLTDASVFATDTNGKQRTTVAPGSYNAATGADTVNYSPSFVGPGPGTGTASTYVPVTPTRIVTQTPLGQGATMSVQVAGGSSPVPADATAVTLNLTGVSPTHSTYLQAYPKVLGSSAVPKVSNLNLSQGQKAAVAVQVAVGSGGNVVIRNAFGTVGVIVDVSGYFVAGTGGAGYAPLTVPSRAYDGTLVGKSSRTVDLSGLAPTGAVAAVVNLTAANPSQTTYLAVTPDPVPAGSNPTVSNLNLPAHATRANLVTVPLSAGGTVSVFNYTGSVRAIVDVSGFYTSQAGHLAYYPLTPTRVLDTRYATNTYLGSTAPIGSGRTYYFTLGQTTTTADGIVTVPAGAQAVAYNVTAVLPTANTYLTVYGDPTTNARPTASNLNLAAGTTVPNMVIAALPANRLIGIYNLTGSTPVLADLNGYYAP